MNNAPQPYTLSQLAQTIKAALSFMPQDTYWVTAEIASLSSKGGHMYAELVEKNDKGIAAKMRATCWNNINTVLSAYFEEETGQRLQAGMKVLIEAEVSFHTFYGLSLNIRNIDPRYTIGDLARQRQLTIRRLQEEGIYDLQQQFVLPSIVQRLAIITATDAAGYGDFTDQLQQSGYIFFCTLFPAVMQGEKAEGSIIGALDEVKPRCENFDAVVIIRGGGATIDLECFDSYRLARECALFPIPVITGIGHTRDVSIVDMIAHLPLKTPTAVAAFLVSRMDSLADKIARLRERLKNVAEKQILIRRHRIELLRQRVMMCSPERIYRLGYSLAKANGKAVKSVEDLKSGEKLTTCFIDGEIQSIVE